jgi:hypothetical protein
MHDVEDSPRFDLLLIQAAKVDREFTIAFCEISDGDITDISDDTVFTKFKDKHYKQPVTTLVDNIEKLFPEWGKVKYLGIFRTGTYAPVGVFPIEK